MSDYGCNVDDPESLVMAILDNGPLGERVVKELAANGYSIVRHPTPVTEGDELVVELLHAVKECRSVSSRHKQEVESLTGYSFNAIADYTQRAAARIQSDAVTIKRMREGLRDADALLAARGIDLDNPVRIRLRAILTGSGCER